MNYVICSYTKFNTFYLYDNKKILFTTRLQDALRFSTKLNAEDNKELLKYKGCGNFNVVEVYD